MKTFVNFDTLIKVDSFARFVLKNEPGKILMKISKSDYEVIKTGVFKKQNNILEFNGKTYYLPDELSKKLMLICKNKNIPYTEIVISETEFNNEDIITDLNYKINNTLLKNISQPITIVCEYSKNYAGLIEKIKKEINIEKVYYLSDNSKTSKDVMNDRKVKLFLELLTGYKIENKFVDTPTNKTNIKYYDYNVEHIKKDLNDSLELFLSRSEDGIRSAIKEDIKDFKPFIELNTVSDNELNNVETEILYLSVSTLTYEKYLLQSSKHIS